MATAQTSGMATVVIVEQQITQGIDAKTVRLTSWSCKVLVCRYFYKWTLCVSHCCWFSRFLFSSHFFLHFYFPYCCWHLLAIFCLVKGPSINNVMHLRGKRKQHMPISDFKRLLSITFSPTVWVDINTYHNDKQLFEDGILWHLIWSGDWLFCDDIWQWGKGV